MGRKECCGDGGGTALWYSMGWDGAGSQARVEWSAQVLRVRGATCNRRFWGCLRFEYEFKMNLCCENWSLVRV